MSAIFEIKTLARRLRAFVADDERLGREAASPLEEAVLRGDFERGEPSHITGLPERSARRVLNDGTSIGLLASETPKGPVSLRFPPDVAETLFPRLF